MHGVRVCCSFGSGQLNCRVASAFDLPCVTRAELPSSTPVASIAFSRSKKPARLAKPLISTARAIGATAPLADLLEMLEQWPLLLGCEQLICECCRCPRDLRQILESRGPYLYVPSLIEHVHNAAADFKAEQLAEIAW